MSHWDHFEVFVELCLFTCALLIELLCELANAQDATRNPLERDAETRILDLGANTKIIVVEIEKKKKILYLVFSVSF